MRGRPAPARADLPLLVALLAQLAVLAALPRVVTVDGPGHVAGGWALSQLLLPGGAEVVQRLYEVDPAPVPNLLVTVLLAVLVPLLGADGGERVLVAGIVLLLPLALRWALRGVDPRAGWLAVLGVPFASGYLLLYGFYNFVLGLGLMLLCTGLVLHRRDGWTGRSAAGLAALLLLTWSAHLLPLLAAGAVCGVLAAGRALQARRWAPLLPVLLAGLPVLGLTLLFLAGDAAERGPAERAQPLALLTGLVGLRLPLVAYSPWEQVPAAVLAVLLLGLAARAAARARASAGARASAAHCSAARQASAGAGRLPSGGVVGAGSHSSAARQVSAGAGRLPSGGVVGAGSRGQVTAGVDRRALAVATGLAVLAYALVPQRFGPEYGFLDDRLAHLPPLLLLLACAQPPPATRRATTAVVGTALACAALLGALRLPYELRSQRAVADVLALADAVPSGSVVVGLRLQRDPPAARNPFRDPVRHVVSRLAVEARSVDAGHYEAALPYFPVRFADATSPRKAVDPSGTGLDAVPPVLDLSGGVVDAVVVTGRGPGRDADLSSEGFVRTAVSPRGSAALWLRR